MQPEELIGQMLGHYQIKQQIGYGGMATVFLARDIHLDREVALKVFWPRPGETQDFLRRFSREARVLAQLDHPHILPVYDYGEQGELAFLVTPYLSGGTLKDMLLKRKVLPPSEAIQLMIQVLPALQYAHDRNLIHRDIKPGNLLFKSDGTLVLADFGLVKVVEGEGLDHAPLETMSRTGQGIAGTPEYMSPEQIEGKAVAASDIYSLGIVLYEMVTGIRPFTGTTLLGILMKHVNEFPKPPHLLNSYISLPLEAVILRALEKSPDKRFARPLDFLLALEQAAGPARGSDMNQTAVSLGAAGSTVGAGWEQTVERTPQPVVSYPLASGASNPGQPSVADPSLATQAPVVLAARQSVNPITPVQPWVPPPPTSPAFIPPGRQQQERSRAPAVVLALLCVLLAGLVASLFLTPLRASLFGAHISPTATTVRGGVTTTPVVRGGNTPTPVSTTQAMPSTQTSCPGDGLARAAVIAPLALGHHPAIVYIVNERDAANHPTFGTVKIKDIVTGGKLELAKTDTTVIDEAQVSNDGQWALFAATIGGQSQLRMVRVDGQGLQTLFCAPHGMTIRYSQWSFDQKYVIFDAVPEIGSPAVYLLNMQTGALQVEMPAPAAGISLAARTWLDVNRVLMVGFVPNSDAPPQNIYILDIRNGPGQSLANAQKVFDSATAASPTCWDFDSSYDARNLFIGQCTQSLPNGSSTIIKQPVTGGASTPVLHSSTLSISTVRVIDTRSTRLLAISSDTGPGTPDGDPEHDGLYLVKTNGSQPQRLAASRNGSLALLNAFSQYFWSNVSRDGRFYALETWNPATSVYTLAYGSLNGGAPIVFASITNTAMMIAGWTTT